jgi:hypothetical protein
MRFLMRAAFWFAVVLAFWPNGSENRRGISQALENTVPVLASFVTPQRLLSVASDAQPVMEKLAAQKPALRPSFDDHIAGQAPVTLTLAPIPAPRPNNL